MVFQLPGCPSNKRDGPCLEVVCGVRPTLCLGVYIGCEFNSAAFFQSQSHSSLKVPTVCVPQLTLAHVDEVASKVVHNCCCT